MKTKDYFAYVEKLGFNLNDKVPVSKSFDDVRIYDSLYFDVLEKQAFYNGKMEFSEEVVRLRAHRDFKAGEEVTYSIGPYLNYELVANYGLLRKNNPNEFF